MKLENCGPWGMFKYYLLNLPKMFSPFFTKNHDTKMAELKLEPSLKLDLTVM
jgi:hypothetical protein